MNDLVTVFGASGFVGRHVVRRLALGGWRIRAVCRHPNLANFLLPDGAPGQIQIVAGNVRDAQNVAKALKGAAAAVNLVGILYERGRQSFEAMHVDAAGTIARAARKAGIETLVHFSAVGADRTAEARYAQTKGEGEWRGCDEYPDAVILRPSLVFGPEDAFFNTFAWLARYAPFLPLVGGGETRFQPVYAGDVAAAVQRAISGASARGKTFELGGPNIYTFRELIRFAMRESGHVRPLVPLPTVAAKIAAFFLQMPSHMLPVAPLLTVDQVRLLKSDNVVGKNVPTLADLGIVPQAMEGVVPLYLRRFRPEGEYSAASNASAKP